MYPRATFWQRWAPPAHLQTSEPGICCDRREWSRGIRRRSTHLFSQRSPGDVGQDEQDRVSWRRGTHTHTQGKEDLIISRFTHFCVKSWGACCCRWTGKGRVSYSGSKFTLSCTDIDRAPWLSENGDSAVALECCHIQYSGYGRTAVDVSQSRITWLNAHTIECPRCILPCCWDGSSSAGHCHTEERMCHYSGHWERLREVAQEKPHHWHLFQNP